MQLTIEYISRKFDTFNEMCFEGKLQPLPFRITHARTFLGMVRCKRERRLLGKWRYYDFEFIVSDKTTLLNDEREIEDVILHEMIHYYILSNQLQDSSAHGILFRRIMKSINQRFGRHITTSHKKTKADMENDTEKRLHYIAVVRLLSGKTGITVAAHSRLLQLWDAYAAIPDVAECLWFVSYDPFFNRFLRAQKAKIYFIDNDELQEHLASAKPLVRRENGVFIGKCATS